MLRFLKSISKLFKIIFLEGILFAFLANIEAHCALMAPKTITIFSNLNQNNLVKIDSPQMKIYYRQGEFLHGLAVVYESIYEIDRWWIGLTDLGMFQFSSYKRTSWLLFLTLFVSTSELSCKMDLSIRVRQGGTLDLDFQWRKSNRHFLGPKQSQHNTGKH
jgi:hypothetical protein